MRYSFFIVLLAASLLHPLNAWSENPQEDFGKSAVAQTLMKQAKNQESAPVRTISAPAASSPYEYHEEIPEDVDALMERVETQNSALVEEFEQLLQKDALNPDAPKWLGQIAEFHWQTAHYAYLRARRAWLAELDKCVDDETKCPEEPQADYHESINDYRKILANYPSYEHMDDVLFRLGDALIRNKQSKEGISYLHRLTQSYPNYKDLDAAYLAMGEFYFSQKNTGTAQAAYQTIIDKYPKSTYYQYAQYKLAWTYLNLADDESYLTAIQLFKQVIESIDSRYLSAVDSEGQIDENKLKTGEVSFRNQALNDLSTTYAELPGGWKEARTFLNTKLPKDKARDKIEQLGGILDAQGKFEEEIELYSDLIAESPNHPHAIDWRLAKIEALKASNRLDEAETVTRETIAAVSPESTWYAANKDDKKAFESARKFASYQLYILAVASIENAEKTNDAAKKDAYWADAEDLLLQQIKYYPNEKTDFDIYYSYAYVLDERSDAALSKLKKEYGKRLKTEPSLASDVLEKLKLAATAYQKIISWEDKTDREEQIKVAANRQVFVYANILATSDPEWSIINSAKTTSFIEEKRGSAVLEATRLTDAELGFVHSAEQYAALYPKDDETPAFLWRAAEIYRSHNDYNQAAGRFDQIVTNFPDHQYAAVAVGSMFELYNKANNYEKIEYWSKWLIEQKNFKHYTESELEDTASFAIDKQAVALADAQKTDEAVSTMMRIEQSFPHRKELSSAARFKASAFEESREGWAAAIALLLPLETDAPKPEQRAHAAYKIGVDSVRIARYSQAAQAFERSAKGYFEIARETNPSPTDEPVKSKANSKKKTAKPEESKNTPKLSDDNRLEAALSIFYGAQIYRNLNDTEHAAAILDSYLAVSSSEGFALYQVGDTQKTEISDDEKNNAVALLTKTTAMLERASLEDVPSNAMNQLAVFQSDEAISNEVPALQRQVYFQWTQYAVDSKNIDEGKRALSKLTPDENDWNKAELARYQYLQGKISQLEFESVVLEFPVRTLRKRIEQKAAFRQTAEKYFRQAISYKVAQISTASAYEISQMALYFRDAFKNLPAPKELENDPDGLEEYTTWLEDELIFPAEDAAAAYLDAARQITVQLESYTKEAKKSAQSLAELKPDDYPVSKSSIVF